VVARLAGPAQYTGGWRAADERINRPKATRQFTLFECELVALVGSPT
jgi:hypothetical protein